MADSEEKPSEEDEWATVEKPKASRRLAPQKTLTKADFTEKPQIVPPKVNGKYELHSSDVTCTKNHTLLRRSMRVKFFCSWFFLLLSRL
jgi:hypothetical protein